MKWQAQNASLIYSESWHMRFAVAFLALGLSAGCATRMSAPVTGAPAAGLTNMILVRQTSKTPDQAVDAILAVYQKAGRTEISMLDARYMSMASSHPEVARASAMAGPALTQMLDAVAK